MYSVNFKSTKKFPKKKHIKMKQDIKQTCNYKKNATNIKLFTKCKFPGQIGESFERPRHVKIDNAVDSSRVFIISIF